MIWYTMYAKASVKFSQVYTEALMNGNPSSAAIAGFKRYLTRWRFSKENCLCKKSPAFLGSIGSLLHSGVGDVG